MLNIKMINYHNPKISHIYFKFIRPLRNFCIWVKKSIQYSIFLWHDHDYDYMYLLTLIQYKIGRMRVSMSKNNRIVHANRYCREMLFAE